MMQRKLLVSVSIVGNSRSGVKLDVLSAFRPCGRDLVEFFNSTDWAFYVKWRCHCGCRMANIPVLIFRTKSASR